MLLYVRSVSLCIRVRLNTIFSDECPLLFSQAFSLENSLKFVQVVNAEPVGWEMKQWSSLKGWLTCNS